MTLCLTITVPSKIIKKAKEACYVKSAVTKCTHEEVLQPLLCHQSLPFEAAAVMSGLKAITLSWMLEKPPCAPQNIWETADFFDKAGLKIIYYRGKEQKN